MKMDSPRRLWRRTASRTARCIARSTAELSAKTLAISGLGLSDVCTWYSLRNPVPDRLIIHGRGCFMMTFSDQSIGRDRVVVDFPGVGQRAVQFEKVPQAGRIAPPDDFFRDVVTTASHSLSNAGDAGLRARQPYVDEMEPKTG